MILATHATTVVQVVTALENDRNSASRLIWESKNLLACNFVSKGVLFNHHSCNTVAHELAALGAGLGLELFSIRDSIPVCI